MDHNNLFMLVGIPHLIIWCLLLIFDVVKFEKESPIKYITISIIIFTIVAQGVMIDAALKHRLVNKSREDTSSGPISDGE
jgi:hypothetical protein